MRRLCLLLVAEVLAVIVATELGLRVARGHSPSLRRQLYMAGLPTRYDAAHTLRQLMEASPHGFLPYRRHGDFLLNSHGLKTSEYARAKAQGTLRVVVLGDSFTFDSGGVPYDELWHRQLERRLDDACASRVEVLSLGIRSVGPDFYRRIWEVEGSHLEADLVVVAFFIGNDFSDVLPARGDEDGLDVWARRSFLVRLVRNRLRDRDGLAPQPDAIQGDEAGGPASQGGIKIPGFTNRYDPDRPPVRAEAFLAGHGVRFSLFTKNRYPPLEETFERVRAHIDAIHDQVSASGARLVFMLMPAEPQVNPALEHEIAELRGIAEQDYDLDAPNRLVREWAALRGILCLDLTPAFRERQIVDRLYRVSDTHWNPNGNALAAQELFEFMVQQGVIEDGDD